MNKSGLLLLSSVLATALSVLSVFVERTGPELTPYSNLCDPASNDSCLKPVLKGGFPVAFLFDQPGVSVERQLSFGEDILRIGALAVNTGLYFIVVMLFVYAMKLPRKGKTP